MIGPWLENQPKGISDLLDPSMGPAEATRELCRVLDSDEQVIECVKSLDEFISLKVQVSEGSHLYTMGVLETVGNENEQLLARIARLETDLAIARAAMGPLGTPPLPGAGTVAPNGQVMVGIPNEHQPPANYTEIQFPLPNDPRLP